MEIHTNFQTELMIFKLATDVLKLSDSDKR